MESRMRGDMQVRFGGRYEETYCRKAARRLVPRAYVSGICLFCLASLAIARFRILFASKPFSCTEQ